MARTMPYHDVRRELSDHFTLEITCQGGGEWLSTFGTTMLAACAYEVVAPQYGLNRAGLNFHKTAKEAEFLALPCRSCPARWRRQIAGSRRNAQPRLDIRCT